MLPSTTMKKLGMTRVLLTVGLGLALTMPAAAQTGVAQTGAPQTEEQRAGARAAATQGATAFREERWQDAIDLFERAESLVHAPPHLLYMARAHEKLGRLVTARELYNKITRERLSPDSPKAFHDAQKAAVKELAAIEPRLARLTVKVDAPEGVKPTVTMDGSPYPSALVGIARPVDPGKHQVAAQAPGHIAEPIAVSLEEGGSQTITIQLVVDPNAAPPPPPPDPNPPPVTDSPPPDPRTPPQPERDHGVNGLRIGSYAALGVGVVGLGLGTAFGLRSSSLRSDADDAEEDFLADCGDTCLKSDPRAKEIDSLDSDAKSAQTVATVGFVVGGVGLATGAVLYLLSGNKKETAKEPSVRAWMGVNSVGLTGRF